MYGNWMALDIILNSLILSKLSIQVDDVIKRSSGKYWNNSYLEMGLFKHIYRLLVFNSIKNNFVSLTPLTVSYCRQALSYGLAITNWLRRLQAISGHQ